MKTMIINCSPRRNGNTAQLLKKAEEGARSSGAEVEYIELYALDFKGCRGCMACKRKGAEPRHCFYPDGLTDIINRMYDADTIIFGTPIYLGDVSSGFRAVLERFSFINLFYGDPVPFTGRINIGMIVTMNATRDWYERGIRQSIESQLQWMNGLNGIIRILPCFDTLQVKDYSRYHLEFFDARHKQQVHDEIFPQQLEQARQLGFDLSRH